MEVLIYLAERPGQVVTNDELLDAFWRGGISAPNAVYKSITELRQGFGDDARRPTFIQTISRRGYRLIAPVERDDGSGAASGIPMPMLIVPSTNPDTPKPPPPARGLQ